MTGTSSAGPRPGSCSAERAITVQGNFLGTDTTGTIDLGNDTTGITVSGSDHIVGGIGAGEANTIAFNGSISGAGVVGQRPAGRDPRQPHLREPLGERAGGSGSSSGSFGIQVNDEGDGDSGANGFQNYPILLSAGPALAEGGGNHIVGVLNSTPSTQFTSTSTPIPRVRPGRRSSWRARFTSARTEVTTNGSGDAAIDISWPANVSRARASAPRRPIPTATPRSSPSASSGRSTSRRRGRRRAARPSRSRACSSRTGPP